MFRHSANAEGGAWEPHRCVPLQPVHMSEFTGGVRKLAAFPTQTPALLCHAPHTCSPKAEFVASERSQSSTSELPSGMIKIKEVVGREASRSY